VEAFPISIAGVKIGSLAVRAAPGQNDKGFFAFVAGEIAPALRAVILTEEARRLALTDALTGLWNRRGASETLFQCAAAAQRYKSQLSVAMLDVDYFKRINDNHGHHSGDLALQHIAILLQRAARKADITARWGGEEFLFIMPSTGAPGARVAAERVRMSVADSPVTLEDGTALRITASIGIATLKPEEHHSDLVNRADQALYLAKERGRNRVEQG
jgi:diguanylate cyclase (GGDEF)-like protein